MEKFYTLIMKGNNLDRFFSNLFYAKEITPTHWIIYDHQDYIGETHFTIKNNTFTNAKVIKKSNYKPALDGWNKELIEIRIYKTGKIKWNRAL